MNLPHGDIEKTKMLVNMICGKLSTISLMSIYGWNHSIVMLISVGDDIRRLTITDGRNWKNGVFDGTTNRSCIILKEDYALLNATEYYTLVLHIIPRKSHVESEIQDGTLR